MKTRKFKIFGCMLTIFAVIASVGLTTSFAGNRIVQLDNDEISTIVGGGNDKCWKSTACGSAYCEKVNNVWKNCKGNTTRSFCVTSDDDDDNCDSDGSSFDCDVWQECTSDTCASCTPTTTSCSRTTAGSGHTKCD